MAAAMSACACGPMLEWLAAMRAVLAPALAVLAVGAAVLALMVAAASLFWILCLRWRIALLAGVLALIPAETLLRAVVPGLWELPEAFEHVRLALFLALWLPNTLMVVNGLAWVVVNLRDHGQVAAVRARFGWGGCFTFFFRQLREERARLYVAPVPALFDPDAVVSGGVPVATVPQ